MPLDEEKTNPRRNNRAQPCRKSCLKKYKKPSFRGYQGKTFMEKVDYCVSAHYVCCKPERDADTKHPDIRAKCIEEISREGKANHDKHEE